MNNDELKALIARNPIHPKYGVPVPCTLICIVTGKETKYTAPEYIKGKIDAAGSLEALLSSYVCRGARKDGGGAPKAPKSTKTWKGKSLVDEKQDVKTDGTPIADVVPFKPMADIIHHEFKLRDGGTCDVFSPRTNPDQSNVIVHDFRKKVIAPN